MEETPLVHALTMALIRNHDVMFEKMPDKVSATGEVLRGGQSLAFSVLVPCSDPLFVNFRSRESPP
jgi:hypothetical protein